MVAGQPIGTMIGSLMINNAQAGFIIGAVIMLAFGFVALAIWPREESSKDMERTKMTLKDLAVSFHFPKFSTSRDFYKAFGCRVCMLLSYQMISVYQLYIVEDYVHQTKTEAAGTIATMSIITMVVSLTASLISGPISDKMHTRKVPVIIASLLFAIGTAMPWIMPSVTGMYLYAGIAGSATACTQPSTKRSTSTCCRTRKRPVRTSASSTWPPRSARRWAPPSPRR